MQIRTRNCKNLGGSESVLRMGNYLGEERKGRNLTLLGAEVREC
jgi:hypothetical protein